MANMVGRLGVVLGLDSAEFVRGIDGASKRLNDFAEKAVVAGRTAALALTAAAGAALKYADDIYDTAKANDVAIDTIVKMKLALNQAGGSAENAGKLMSSFTAFIDKAAGGSLEAQRTFAKLGISFKDITNLSMDELFAKTTQALSGQADAITRNAMAMEVFGKGMKGVDVIDFADNMKSVTELTKAQTEGVKEAGRFFDLLSKATDRTAMAMTGALAPAMEKINELLDGYINKNRSFIDTIHDAYNRFLPGMIVERLPQYMRKTPGGVGKRGGGYDVEDDSPKRKGKVAIDDEIAKRQMEQDKIRDNWLARVNKSIAEAQKIAEANYRLTLKELDVDINRLRTEEDLQLLKDQTYQSILQSNRLQSQQLDFDRANLLLVTQFTNLRSEEVKYAQDVMSIRAKYAEQEYQIATFSTMNEHEKTKALEENNNLRDRAIQQAKEALDITRQSREGTMADGFTKGFDEFVRDMPTRMEMGKTAFNSLMSSMDSALRRFVQTGKLNFKDLVRSMIQELIYLESKAKMMDMFKSLKGDGGGGGIMDMLGGLFGGGGGGGAMGGPANFDPFGLVGFANGGSPPVGQASLVGERGPELFVPRTAGTIIPNNQLSSMGGGSTVNYNGPYIASMNAIDTQSGTQFLAKNKNTIWAAYQSANRGVPVSR
jgi:lambda family phage tail tape measure protein